MVKKFQDTKVLITDRILKNDRQHNYWKENKNITTLNLSSHRFIVEFVLLDL